MLAKFGTTLAKSGEVRPTSGRVWPTLNPKRLPTRAGQNVSSPKSGQVVNHGQARATIGPSWAASCAEARQMWPSTNRPPQLCAQAFPGPRLHVSEMFRGFVSTDMNVIHASVSCCVCVCAPCGASRFVAQSMPRRARRRFWAECASRAFGTPASSPSAESALAAVCSFGLQVFHNGPTPVEHARIRPSPGGTCQNWAETGRTRAQCAPMFLNL